MFLLTLLWVNETHAGSFVFPKYKKCFVIEQDKKVRYACYELYAVKILMEDYLRADKQEHLLELSDKLIISQKKTIVTQRKVILTQKKSIRAFKEALVLTKKEAISSRNKLVITAVAISVGCFVAGAVVGAIVGFAIK